MKEYRDWQKNLFTQWYKTGFYGCVKARTGAGKTLAGISVIDQYRQMNPTMSIMVIVPSKKIAEGWESSFDEQMNNVYTMLSLDNPEVYRDLSNDSEELPLPEDVDRRCEATVSPVSAFEWELERLPQAKTLGQGKPLWEHAQKQGISELFGWARLRVDFEAGERKGAFRPFPWLHRAGQCPSRNDFSAFDL